MLRAKNTFTPRDVVESLYIVLRKLARSWVDYNVGYLLEKAVDGISAPIVIDAGCGNGRYTNFLSHSLTPSLVVAIDFSDAELRKAKAASSWLNQEFVCADAHMLPLRSSVGDLIFASDLLHHTDQPISVLKELERVHKQGHTLVILEAERSNPLMDLWIPLGHNHFTSSQLSKLISLSGLRVETIRRVAAYPEGWFFWSGRIMELPWDSIVIVFHSTCSLVPQLPFYIHKLLSVMLPPSYNLVRAE